MIPLDVKEIVPLYLSLSSFGGTLEPRLVPLLTRLERYLYEHLTVEEMERLPELYAHNVDVLEKKL